MSNKLNNNKRWESSRFMLPQHIEALLNHQESLKIKQKPELHEDEWQIVFENINMAIHSKEQVRITIFGEIEDRVIEGIITSVNQFSKKFKLEVDDGFEWFDFDEILKVEMC